MTKLDAIAFHSPLQQRLLALAGMTQAAHLVHQVATSGQLQTEPSMVSWQSLFVTNPQHISEIYGGNQCLPNLNLGLNTLSAVLQQDPQTPVAEITRYLIGMIHLQGKLSKNPSCLENIAKQLDRSAQQVELYGIAHANVTASLADIYTHNLSQFRFRIQVTGNPVYLQQATNANRVRSLLLAGIRSTVLWRQLGGRRWHFVLGKQKLEQHLQTLLNLLSQ